MKINRSNYESYFLDYIEGRLNADDTAEVLAFLALEPDLAAELEGLKEAMLSYNPEDAEDLFDLKNALKKSELPLDSENLNLLLARHLEGDLEGHEKQQLQSWIVEYPSVKSAVDAFAKTKLQAEHIVFPDKAQLHFPEQLDLSNTQHRIIAAIEGDLSANEMKALENAMATEPALRQMYNALQRVVLKGETIVFEDKKSIAFPASIDLGDSQYLLVAELEGDLDNAGKQQLKTLLHGHPELKRDQALFAKTKLQPAAVVFDAKDSLRKKAAGRVIPLGRYFAFTSAAAALAFLIWTGWMNPSQPASHASQWKHQWNQASPKHDNSSDSSHDSTNVNGQRESNTEANPNDRSVYPTIIQNNPAPQEYQENIDVAQQTPAPVQNEPSLEISPLTPEEAGQLANNEPKPVVSPDMQQILHGPSVTPGNGTEYMTIWEYAQNEAKSRLWGDENYPRDGFALALVQKQMNKKPSEKPAAIEYDRVTNGNEKQVRLKLGRFEVVRKKKK